MPVLIPADCGLNLLGLHPFSGDVGALESGLPVVGKVSPRASQGFRLLTGRESRFGWQEMREPSGLWRRQLVLPQELEMRLPSLKYTPNKDKVSYALRREAIGACNVSTVSIHDVEPVSINLTAPVDAIDRYQTVKRESFAKLDDAKIFIEDFVKGFDVDDRHARFAEPAALDHALRLVEDAYPHLVEAYEVWWTLATENNSLSSLRAEYLFNLVQEAKNAKTHMPVVVKVSLPFGKLNTKLGTILATQVKWDVLALSKKIFGADAGAVTFIDSTGVALALPDAQYATLKIREFVGKLAKHFTDYLKSYLAVHPETPGVRDAGREIEFLGENNKWIPMSSVLSGDVFAGAARIEVGKTSSDATVRKAIQRAEIVARARAEKIKEQTERHSGVPFVHALDDYTKEAQLALGKGALPDGHIPDENDVLHALYQVYRKVIREPSGLSLPARHVDYKEFAAGHDGLKKIYEVCEVIAKEYYERDTSAASYFASIMYAFRGLDPFENEYSDFLKSKRYLVDVFCEKSIALVTDRPLKSFAVFELMQRGGQRAFIAKAKTYAGELGALTDIKTYFTRLKTLSQNKVPISNARVARPLRGVSRALSKLYRLVTQDLPASLIDPRFPGKIKYRAFALGLADKMPEGKANLVILDYDNLKAYLHDNNNAVAPEQLYDSAKYRLEKLIMQAAAILGIAKEVVYSSPGGDEIVIKLPTHVDPEVYIQILRELKNEQFKKIKFGTEKKVNVVTPEGDKEQRWLVYEREKGEMIAISGAKRDDFEAFLQDHTLGKNKTIRVFRLLRGMQDGGVLIDEMPMDALAGYERAVDTVGISATHVELEGIRVGETISHFAERIDRLVDKGLAIVSTAKKIYGKDMTWNMNDKTEQGLITGNFELKPHHVGYHSLVELQEIFRLNVLIRSASHVASSKVFLP